MTLTKMEKCFKYVINTLRKYSEQEEPHDKFSKDEFANLVKEQLPNFLQASRTLEYIDALFEQLDQDKDGRVSLMEVIPFVDKLLRNLLGPLRHDH